MKKLPSSWVLRANAPVKSETDEIVTHNLEMQQIWWRQANIKAESVFNLAWSEQQFYQSSLIADLEKGKVLLYDTR